MANVNRTLFAFVLAALLMTFPSVLAGDLESIATRAEAAPAGGITIVSQECISSDRVSVVFGWQASGDGAQWVDLSLVNNGFTPNTFIGLGPLPAGQNSLAWDGLLAGTTHYLRINTLTGAVWQPSPTVFFTTRSCAGFAGATAVTLISQSCLEDGRVRITLAWNPSGQGQQWVELSLHNNGFAANTFIGLGPLPATQHSFIWDGLLPGLSHYLRITTQTASGRAASTTLVFTTLANCANPGATSLRVLSQTCQDDGRVTVNFAWNPSALGVFQWFDLSARNDKFSSPFYGFGPLPPSQSILGIPHLEDGHRYYVRLNTFTGYGWAPASTLLVDTRHCETAHGHLTIQKECLPANLAGEPFTIRVVGPGGQVKAQAVLDCGEASDPIPLDLGVEYTVIETDPVAHSDVRYRGLCDGDGTLTFDPSDLDGTCVVTNALQASLTIRKECLPADLAGGPFTIRVLNPDDEVEAQVELECGEDSDPITVDAGVEYTVVEIDPVAGSEVSYRGLCDGDGTLTFDPSDLDGTCVVTNDGDGD